MNWGLLKAKIDEVAERRLRPLIDGTEDDVRATMADITDSLWEAVQDEDEHRAGELLSQVALLAEKHRVTIKEEAWSSASEIMDTAVAVAVAGIRAAGGVA